MMESSHCSRSVGTFPALFRVPGCPVTGAHVALASSWLSRGQRQIGVPAQLFTDAFGRTIDGVIDVAPSGADAQASSVVYGERDDASDGTSPRRQRDSRFVYDVTEPRHAREDPVLRVGPGLAAERASDVRHRDSHVRSSTGSGGG